MYTHPNPSTHITPPSYINKMVVHKNKKTTRRGGKKTKKTTASKTTAPVDNKNDDTGVANATVDTTTTAHASSTGDNNNNNDTAPVKLEATTTTSKTTTTAPKRKRKRKTKAKTATATATATAPVVAAPENTTKTTTATMTNDPPAMRDPVMIASHQTHGFAAATLDSMFKFTRDRLMDLMANVYGETDGNKMAENCDLVLGKRPIKIKKLSDPNKPKRPSSAYQLFCRDYHKSVVQSGTGTEKKSLIELSKEQSQKWRTLSDEDKKPFQVEADTERDLYKAKLDAYKNRLRHISRIYKPVPNNKDHTTVGGSDSTTANATATNH